MEKKTHKTDIVEDFSGVSVRCFDDVKLAKAGEYIVRGQVECDSGVVGLLEAIPISENEEFVVGSGLVEVDQKKVIPVRIWTLCDGMKLKKGMELGKLSLYRYCVKPSNHKMCRVISESDMKERWDKLKPQFERQLQGIADEERSMVVPLLKEFADIFSVDKNDIGLTDLVTHQIDIGTENPIACAYRRVPIPLEDKVEDMIQDLVRKGIIRPSESAWNAPLVVVPKKNGDIRLTVDYRKLNAITKRPVFPIPDARQLLDTLHGSCYFSTLDLSSGYYNVPMRDVDIEKTAFSTRKNHWEFVRMPMGLSTSPCTFQRLMHTVFDKENWHSCLIYLDDILVFARTIEEQLRRLRTIFERIRSSGLKLSPEKCEFLKREVSYLGYRITEYGTRTDEKKIEKITNWKKPTSAEELRSWLGLCGYYRHFIKNYSELALPLEKLCKSMWNKKSKKKTEICWTNECHDSFERLKIALTSAPVLAYPTKDGQFVLDTDASHDAMGSVLSQIQNGEEKVIAYGSKKFTQSQRQYCITRKELLAVHHFVHHFKQYLLGRPFIVRTDHRALTWMMNWKTPNTSQYCRWRQELEIFDMDVRYRKGEEHLNADALSRWPHCEQCEVNHKDPKRKTNVKNLENEQDKVERVFCRNIVSLKSNLDQSKDPNIKIVMDLLKAGRIDEKDPNEISSYGAEAVILWKRRKELRLRGGQLFILLNDSQYRLIVPKESRTSLIKTAHETFAHIGVKKTLNLMKESYYWLNMDTEVKVVIGMCKSCAERKISPLKKHETGTLQSSYPFQRISIDITGPLISGRNGERYILGIIDNFSRFVSLIPLKQATGVDVAKALYKRWITVFGSPESIHSDRGTEFENEVIRDLCTLFNIRKSKSSPYYPKGNSMIERTFKTVKDMLYASMRSCGRNWTEVIPAVEMALRSCQHNETKFSPYEVVFGRKMTTPLSIQMDNYKNTRKVNVSKYVSDIRQSMDQINQSIRQKINGGRSMPGKQMATFKEGETVMAKILPRIKGLGQPRYDGPYTIQKIKGKWCYELRHQRTGKVIERNYYHLKKCYSNIEHEDSDTSVRSYSTRKVTKTRRNPVRMRTRTDETRRYPVRMRTRTDKFGYSDF